MRRSNRGYADEVGSSAQDRLDGYAAFHQDRVAWTARLAQSSGAPPGPVLDIGASPLSASLGGLWPGREVWVVDPDPRWQAELSATSIRFVTGSLLEPELPFADGQFSAVVASEVFEHLPECAPHLLEKVARVTAPGGIVAITVPNQARLANRLRLLLGKSIVEPPSQAYHRPWMGYGHLHEYTMAELLTEFRDPRLTRIAAGAFDPYDRGKFQPLISLLGQAGLTGWREVLYAVFRRRSEPPGAVPAPAPARSS
jgi:SAM-dependent methyltransferase